MILTATPRHATAGFTLIELAVSMFIIALLLGAVLVPLATQVEQRQVSETQKTLDDAKEALVGFALANGYLPCPDTTGDGIADPVFVKEDVRFFYAAIFMPEGGRCSFGGLSHTLSIRDQLRTGRFFQRSGLSAFAFS